MRRFILAFFVLILGVGIVVAVRARSSDQTTGADSMTAWMSLGDAEKRPEHFEPYLNEHPDDEARRAAAVVWYQRRDRNAEKLKHHTLQLAQHHPENTMIYFSNVSAFYIAPAYRREVCDRLERQVENGQAKASTFWMLGKMYGQAAIPPLEDKSPARRERFFRYFGLPADTPLPTEIDNALAERAVGYYRRAIQQSDQFWGRTSSQSLANLLIKLEKPEEAVAVCEAQLRAVEKEGKPDFLVTYGHALQLAEQTQEAVRVLRQVRKLDHEGFGRGPAHATTAALTQLGLIALETGDVIEAKKLLLASADVQRCCHNSTKGMPLKLAKRLQGAGECEAVIRYCRLVLDRFTPNQVETQKLLEHCTAAAQED